MRTKVVSEHSAENFEKKLQEVVKELSSWKLSPGKVEIIPMGVVIEYDPNKVGAICTYTAIVIKRDKYEE